MKQILCPVSFDRIQESTVRVTGILIAIVLIVALLSGSSVLAWIIAGDYCIRSFTNRPNSPLSWLAGRLCALFRFEGQFIDKAPKIFAARVGFSFALVGSILLTFTPLTGQITLAILIMFALLESVGNICMGCIVYTHVILRIYR